MADPGAAAGDNDLEAIASQQFIELTTYGVGIVFYDSIGFYMVSFLLEGLDNQLARFVIFLTSAVGDGENSTV